MEEVHEGDGGIAKRMAYGDTIILQNFVNSYQFEVKFVILKKGEKSKIAKGTASHEEMVGYPFGTKFEVVRGKRGSNVVPCAEEETPADLLEELQQGEDSEKDAEPCAKDNRELVDMNQLTKGRENSQKLGSTEIQELRKSGVDGKGVMKSLIENSATFKQKTDFSQEKWLRRKSAKHAPTFWALECTSLSLCRAYFLKDPIRTCHLREDSLARILTLSNVQQGSRVLMCDSINGMLVAAVAERLGGVGRIMNAVNGMQPSVDAVRWMNFGADALETIVNFPFCEMSYMDEDLALLEQAARVNSDADKPNPPPDPQVANDAQNEAKTVDGIDGKSAQETNVETSLKQKEKEMHTAGNGVSDTPMPLDGNAQDASMAEPTGELSGQDKVAGEDTAQQDTLAARQRRLDSALKTSLSFSQRAGTATKTLRDVQQELRAGFDSLVVGGTLLPLAIVPRMVKLLKPSSPFVVFSPFAQPLLDVMDALFKEECAMEMHISETWLREYQVLPGRTHPSNYMSAASGFILTGIKVNRNVPRLNDSGSNAPSSGKRRKKG